MKEIDMKAIIEGLRYDTEKAYKLGEISGNAYTPDVGEESAYDWHEALWMTPGGRFFLCGEGTRKTRWFRLAPPENRTKDRGVERAWAIRALPEDDAKAWVEKYCTPDVYEQLWDVEDA